MKGNWQNCLKSANVVNKTLGLAFEVLTRTRLLVVHFVTGAQQMNMTIHPRVHHRKVNSLSHLSYELLLCSGGILAPRGKNGNCLPNSLVFLESKAFTWELKMRNTKSWGHTTEMLLNSPAGQQKGLLSLTKPGFWKTVGMYRRR